MEDSDDGAIKQGGGRSIVQGKAKSDSQCEYKVYVRVLVYFSLPVPGGSGGELLETQMCHMKESILVIKENFARRLKQEVDNISISFQGTS